MYSRHRKRGFSMVELLVVLFLIAFMLSALAFVFLKNARSAKIQAAQVQLQRLGVALAQYYADFLDILLIDDDDGKVWRDPVERLDIQVVTTHIRMPGLGEKRRLARELLALVRK